MAAFNITLEPARALVRMKLAGFFTPADVAEFTQAWHAAHARLNGRPGSFVTLCDISEISIQGQDALQAFAAISRDEQRRGRRLAMVVGVSLARHQAMRLMDPERNNVAFFFDMAEAEQWLFSDARTDARCRYAPASPRSAGHDCTVPNAA